MRRPFGLTLIIYFYMIIGGLTLALSFFQLVSIINQGTKLLFMDVCFDFIAHNTILTQDLLEQLPQNILILVTFSVTFLTSMFYTVLAEALYLGNTKAYIIGILLHAFSAVSSFALSILGINTLKLIGVFFLSMNLIKATYLYTRARAKGPKKGEQESAAVTT